MRTISERLLELADEIQRGPSGDRQKQIANALRQLAVETAPAPKKEPPAPTRTAGPPRVPARSNK